ncbi:MULTISPECIES: helix-turn-helix transcriptional regulator [unclassified Bradyrhizobium]|nr:MULTISPECIES: response regulator transcription factor [unclassified Bradyrhizobium]MDD1522609.1 helix-turn-helix transcriptional regulator [Bradyrhizobium sp. WBAH30]QCJ93701.1 helix-turn-helix transcriptional regulator [Bradyrhizobium yuanmingense]MDD1546171.1 helix-turn-helix transcriptional regulator [Bradyrhizobium sp. WBAH41]MDD1560051.1 helix-turn-helix transcriptional regulator [Bradyrhizobium sp. WBAH23]MDD1567153.1 helix-turn-helix transcriptional regulator [Bradyrhizobium sp. WBAH
MDDITNSSKRLDGSLHLPVLVFVEPLLLPRTCILNVLRRELAEFEILDMATVESLDCTSTRDVRLVVLSIADKPIDDPSVEGSLAFVAECCPNAAVAILSNHDDEPTVQAAMQRGVRGFLSTSLPIEIAIAGLRLVLVGGVYRPLPVAGMNRIPDFEPPDARGLARASLVNEGAGVTIERSVPDLTPREQQVLAELALGLPNKLIAAKLNLSESTVKMHIQHIMRKCAAHNRTEAVLRWRGRLPSQGHDPGAGPMQET